MSKSLALAITLGQLILQGCGGPESSHAESAGLIFPVFEECQSEIDQLRGLLQKGKRTGHMTIEKFAIPLQSDPSLIGVARVQYGDDPFLRVSPTEYLRSSVSAVLSSCMPNRVVTLKIEGLSNRVEHLMPPNVAGSAKKLRAEIDGDRIRIFLNDGTYDYVTSNNLE